MVLNNKRCKNVKIYRSLVLRFLRPIVFYTLKNMGYLVPFLKPPNLAKAQGQRTPQHNKKMCCTKSLHKISRISLNISLDLQLIACSNLLCIKDWFLTTQLDNHLVQCQARFFLSLKQNPKTKSLHFLAPLTNFNLHQDFIFKLNWRWKWS